MHFSANVLHHYVACGLEGDRKFWNRISEKVLSKKTAFLWFTGARSFTISTDIPDNVR